ncbi:MAG: prolipoprotein diacylglyceryl transferase [Spirulina sp. SIO3F2]|nr:prolipoprotein diacylglyceryl transferase [Spirulina sp. SIO3F2]
MYPPVDPILFQFGPIVVHWYGFFMAAAILVGVQIGSRQVGRQGEDPDAFLDMLPWLLIPGLIGARLYYVFIQSPRGPNGLGGYLAHPWQIINLRSGGIHIFGAFIFGAIALWLYSRWRRIPILTYLDGIGLALPLSQAIGRWGNFINQELYGPPTTLPWGLKIDFQHRLAPYNDLAQYPDTVRFHPLFLYEMLWNLVGFGVILLISRRFERQLQPGDLMLLYLIWYPLGRFLIEFLRTDSWFFGGTPFNTVHLLCASAAALASFAFYRRHFARSSARL